MYAMMFYLFLYLTFIIILYTLERVNSFLNFF
nr:MAG TPA: hypothetical protein [Caudoviricetes sp.]